MIRIANWLLRIYPESWRKRYESEMNALLEQHDISAHTLADLLLAAIIARLQAIIAGGVIEMTGKLRAALATVFCSFMLFGVAFLPIMRVSDPLPTYNQAVAAHPVINLWLNSARISGVAAFLLILSGGLPVLCTVVIQAIRSGRRDVLRPFATALCSLVAFVAVTGLLAVTRFINGATVLLYLLLFAGMLVTGTVSVVRTLLRGESGLRVLRFAMGLGCIAWLAMTVACTSTVLLAVQLKSQVPELLDTQDTGMMFLVGSSVLMFTGVLGGVAGLVKGFRAQVQGS